MLSTSSTCQFEDIDCNLLLHCFQYLVSPFDDDAFNVILHCHVDLLAFALPDSDLFICNVAGSTLRKGKQSLALDVASDLVHGCRQLMDLSLDI